MKDTASSVKAGLLEIIFIILLVLILLLTLNYFGVIKLAKVLPTFSNLPTQTKPTSKPNPPVRVSNSNQYMFRLPKVTKIKQIILPVDSKTVTSVSETKGFSERIQDGQIKTSGPLKVTMELGLKTKKGSQTQPTGGIMLKEMVPSPKTESGIVYLFFYGKDKRWVLKYQRGSLKKYYGLSAMPAGKIYGKFTITISNDGKNVMVTDPTTSDKTFQLPDSLYKTSRNLTAIIQAHENTEVDIYSLSYQY